jgi:hypothetical protein
MSRADNLWGSGALDELFVDGSPITPVPWPRSSQLRTRAAYDRGLLDGLLVAAPRGLAETSPRELCATQPSVTRAGVAYYLSRAWELTRTTYADRDRIGNRIPVVYARDDGQNLLLSGHHRASAALLRGTPLLARMIRGPWGPTRQPFARIEMASKE